jgi:hypothetical protein
MVIFQLNLISVANLELNLPTDFDKYQFFKEINFIEKTKAYIKVGIYTAN